MVNSATATKVLAEPKELNDDEKLRAVVWRLRRQSVSFDDIVSALRVGVPMGKDEPDFFSDASKTKVWRIWQDLVHGNAPTVDVEVARAAEIIHLEGVQRVAYQIMMDSKATSRDRLAAGRTIDRLVRTRADLLGLKALELRSVELVERVGSQLVDLVREVVHELGIPMEEAQPVIEAKLLAIGGVPVEEEPTP